MDGRESHPRQKRLNLPSECLVLSSLVLVKRRVYGSLGNDPCDLCWISLESGFIDCKHERKGVRREHASRLDRLDRGYIPDWPARRRSIESECFWAAGAETLAAGAR